MSDLVTWLRAQLDEDERVAREADGHTPRWATTHDDFALHVQRWDPTRVLAEVEAKRRILELVELAQSDAAVSTPLLKGKDQGYRQGLAEAVWELAQPYAGRDGWLEEWRTA